MNFFTFRLSAYGLLLVFCLCPFWRATDCTTTVTVTVTVTSKPSTTLSPPENVKNVTVVQQTTNSVTIKFDKINGINEYNLTYFINGTFTSKNITWANDTPVEYTVNDLRPAEKYNMTLYSQQGAVQSLGYSFTATTAPENVANFAAVSQNESSITLEWTKTSCDLYILNFEGKETNFTEKQGVVTDLNSSTEYNFTLYSVFKGIRSTGANLTASTAPENVANFTAVSQNESSITLKWSKMSGNPLYILNFEGKETNFTEEEAVLTYLNSSTEYNFTLYSVFKGIRSTGANLTASTAPENVANFTAVKQNESSITLKWSKTSGNPLYILNFEGKETNFTEEEAVLTYLNSSTEYNFTLYSVFKGIRSTGANLTASTAPSKVKGFDAVSGNETSITLKWENDPKINYTLRFNDEEKNFTGLDFENTAKYTVTSLQNTTIYNFTLFSLFRNILGDGVSISAATRPRDATGFKVQNQTNSSITLEWEKVGDIQDYEIEYETKRESVNSSSGNVGTYIAKNLQSGILYTFHLYTKFANVSSQGILLEAPTAPSPVSSVEVVERNLNTITLKWESVKQNWSYLVDFEGTTNSLNISDGNSVYYTVKSLKAGTLYSFSIKTVFMEIESTAIQYTTVTVINCSAVDWQVNDTSILGLVEGEFTNATASNGSLHLNSGSNQQVQFTGLYPGANYSMKLMYEELEQCNHNFTTIPPNLTAECKNWNAGYSIYIEWNKPDGVWDTVEINVSNNVHKMRQNMKFYAEIANFQPARKYQVNISSLSGLQRSYPYPFTCVTDERGVIAGAFFGVFFFVILLCVIAFVMLRRPDIISHKRLSNGGAKIIVKKCVPLEKFPRHFKELSADENKGFNLDYEELASVGTEQTQNAATTPENKPKNRFINVLPYDRSRVKLTSSPQSDYINANYMPGYNSDREFIAAQGPLPSTVSDFWRMIWEQKVRGIVMVTNCTEGGRVKCEQYWPDHQPCQCGDLEVFTTSEKRQPDWTLREFTVKHSRTSEERTVRHFHFTAWPDHGVPEGTQVLIEFRELVRRHMQTEAAETPTVVHCSAGVGRTGTIIALDVLLQQMEKEKAVDIYGFVHKMRLNRPHMVQTESQYVFLHQCVLDSLMQNEKHDENIYENELIYANATALREFQHSNDRS